MQGLLLRLSSLDADAESLVRVISFFDALTEHRADPETILLKTSRLLECPIGMHVFDGDVTIRVGPDGMLAPDDRLVDAVVRDLGVPWGRVWIERPGEPLPLDDLALERFVISMAIAMGYGNPTQPEESDSEFVKVAISSAASHIERTRALQFLGIKASQPIRAVAMLSEENAVESNSPPHGAVVGDFRVVLITDLSEAESIAAPALAMVGIGPALPAIKAPESWRGARIALRFAAPGGWGWPNSSWCGQAVVRWEDLGGLALLPEYVSPAAIAHLPDVVALDRLASDPGGKDTFQVLCAICNADSIRKAAALVYRHHSSLGPRIARAEEALGFSLDTPQGRSRLALALALQRIRDTARLG